MRNNNRMVVKELSGNQFADLQAAQGQALPGLAGDLAATLKRLMDQGVLTVVNGMVFIDIEIDDRYLHG